MTLISYVDIQHKWNINGDTFVPLSMKQYTFKNNHEITTTNS